MSDRSEDARRHAKQVEAKGDPDAGGDRKRAPGGDDAAKGTPSKFAGIQTGEGLQRVGGGGPNSGPYPVQRRGIGTRSIQETEPEAEAEAEDGPSVGAPSPRTPDPAREVEPDEATTPAKRGLSDEAEALAATGISGLDAQYGGGLPLGSLFLLTSEPTTATGVFAAQYAAAGLSEGEAVYYFSLEQPAASVRKAISAFVKDEKDLERLRIIDGYPAQFTDVPEDARRRIGIGKGENSLAALESLLVDPRITAPVRIIVESMSELLSHHEAERVFRVLRVLRGVVQATGATAVVTLVTPLHEPGTVALAKHIADGVVEFHVERKGFGIYPYIAVTKMRGVSGSAKLLLFKETETGLWLESTKRVF